MYRKTHLRDCNCFECSDPKLSKLYLSYSKANNITSSGRLLNHADKTVKDAGYYLGSTLVARNPVTIYKTPDEKSDIVIKYPKGSNVGVIQSWVVRNGQVWWDVNYFSGVHAGWVKHDPDLFDSDIAEQTSSGLEFSNDVKNITQPTVLDNVSDGLGKAVSGIGNTLGSLGDNLKYIIIFIVVLVIIGAYFKFIKK